MIARSVTPRSSSTVAAVWRASWSRASRTPASATSFFQRSQSVRGLSAAGLVGEDPPLMLTPEHLARWRGSGLARLGHPEAIESLSVALAAASDSVRAATGLHADLAHAYERADQRNAAREHATIATDMAQRFGSARQQRRLGKSLAATDR
jgi:hypothetical protein